MVWVLLSLGAAAFTSLTTIFSKIGIKNVNSNFATFFRTGIVMVCCAVMCLISGSFSAVPSFSWSNYLFLGLSGLATGFSWLCYFRALKLGDVNKVAPIDKSSFILTSVLFLIFFFDDTTNDGNALTISMLCVATGGAWLLEYEALNYIGANPVVVSSIGKLSLLLTIAFSFFVLKEKFTKRALFGLALLVSGIVVTVLFGL